MLHKFIYLGVILIWNSWLHTDMCSQWLDNNTVSINNNRSVDFWQHQKCMSTYFKGKWINLKDNNIWTTLKTLTCGGNLAHYCCLDNQLPKRTIVDDIIEKLISNYVSEWKTALCRVESVSGRGRTKLRTYTTFK